MTDIKLKPCPFCGCTQEDDLHVYDGDGVRCGNCGAFAGSMHKSSDIQAAIWNTRTNPRGMVLVPKEPTEAMIKAGSVYCYATEESYGIDNEGTRADADAVYYAMLEAIGEDNEGS